MRFLSILACAGAAPLLIAATQPVRLQPSSPWVVDYAENSCRLVRIFGEGRDVTKLALESPSPGAMDMLVIGNPLSTDLEKAWAAFLPVAAKPIEGSVVKTTTTGEPAVLWSNIPMLPDQLVIKIKAQEEAQKGRPRVRPPVSPVAVQAAFRAARQQFASAATELEIVPRAQRTVILETGSMGDAIAAFDKCSRDSLRDWGVDPDVEDKIVRPVWALNPGQWLSANDYPRDMARNGEQSEVSVRLLVDGTGKVTKCTSLSHFDAPDFNRISCDLITRRARFAPAELADGTKVPSYYEQRVIFRLR